MEIAVGFFVIAALGAFPVIALVVQVYRDSRGKKRNLAMRCYACDSNGYLFPVPHYKGDTFLYCLSCVESQHKSRRVLGYVAVVVIAAVLVGWVVLSQG
ncbi:hypothetical protein [Polaromonas sp. LjRoot131]|jgi:hypothetical protein|uniref:hypothetical protein n=1 Tax=Polaromonas sp. LjRoot131 TaxID=3342262 RepID=UPI003ECEF044